MYSRPWSVATFFLLVSLPWPSSAQQPVPWHDPSPHSVQFIAVDDNVKLEVLDWGGSGRPFVLLAGLGDTAHVFDEFAPKLTSEYHVFGITRRGFGASSVPATGYSADRLGDDVLAVLDALKLDRPVLAGHSIAGEELSSIGSRHPERVAGLIYIDAAYAHAFYDRSVGNLNIDLAELQKRLDRVMPEESPSDHKQLIRELLEESLPQFEKDLRNLQTALQADPAEVTAPPQPSADDLASFKAYRAYVNRIRGINFPEAHLRAGHESRPDGGVGKRLDMTKVGLAIEAGEQKYTEIRVPALAIFANPRKRDPYPFNTATENLEAAALQTAGIEEQAKAFENGVPSARVVRIPQSDHYVFLSNEADVLREIRAFLADLHW
jgi:pimeloyl-ACP methyl ester carboxylesterase